MSKGNLISGYAMTGTPLPISLGGGGDDGYSAGNIGLNYLFPKWPNAPLNPNSNYCENAEGETESGFETTGTNSDPSNSEDKKGFSAINKFLIVLIIIALFIVFLNPVKK